MTDAEHELLKLISWAVDHLPQDIRALAQAYKEYLREHDADGFDRLTEVSRRD